MTRRNLWALSFIISLAFAAGTALLWQQETSQYQHRPGQLTSPQRVSEELNDYRQRHAERTDYLAIPTGVFVQSLEFIDTYDVNLTGYVWQRYDLATPATVSRGIVFPDQISSSETTLERVYRRIEGDKEVIGWYFDVTLRQHFDYTSYPLDRHDVWLRIWHHDFDKNIVLLPDLEAYKSTRERETFGLDRKIVSGSWIINETFFQYKVSEYDTNFGIRDYVGQEGFPELHFNIVISRSFWDAFVLNLVPLFVVVVLLFSVMLVTTKDKERAEVYGFNVSGATGAVSALFFVVMLGHIQLRESLAGANIVYLEQYYFVIYLTILLIPLNIFIFSFGLDKGPLRLLHYDHNLIPKVAFFPLVTGAFFLITWCYF